MRTKTSLRAIIIFAVWLVLLVVISANDGFTALDTGYDGITFNTIEIDEIDCGNNHVFN